MASITAFEATSCDLTHGDFDKFANLVLRRVDMFADQQLFVTDVDGEKLFEAFLAHLPADLRQHHTCRCCKDFFRRYANLVVVARDGSLMSALWSGGARDTPTIYEEASFVLDSRVSLSKIVSPFFSSERTLGVPQTGVWTHFAVTNHNVYKATVTTAHEEMALKREHFGTINRALKEYDIKVIETAVQLLQSEALWRSEKVLGAAKFLLDVREAVKNRRGARRDNIIWRLIAKAPAGHCTPRSGMIGTLLDDIKEGKSFEAVKLRFAEKMKPTNYMRPKAETSVGNIAQGEKLIERMGLEQSLKRRFATIDETDVIWASRPVRKKAPTTGVFGGLTPTARIASLGVDKVAMTMEKFMATVMPTAARIGLQLQHNMHLGAMVTEQIPGSPKLFQWDEPLSWYVYTNGSAPYQWSLPPSGVVSVTGISRRPGYNLPNHGKAVMLVLEGARDTRGAGLGLFPEILRSELHPVRKTIEQFSRQGRLPAPPRGAHLASGLIVGKSFKPFQLEVEFGGNMKQVYLIDRFD